MNLHKNLLDGDGKKDSNNKIMSFAFTHLFHPIAVVNYIVYLFLRIHSNFTGTSHINALHKTLVHFE